jgi:hypothetical protein
MRKITRNNNAAVFTYIPFVTGLTLASNTNNYPNEYSQNLGSTTKQSQLEFVNVISSRVTKRIKPYLQTSPVLDSGKGKIRGKRYMAQTHNLDVNDPLSEFKAIHMPQHQDLF